VFQFRIRELFLVMLTVAIAACWLSDRSGLCRERNLAVHKLQFAQAGKELWRDAAMRLQPTFREGWKMRSTKPCLGRAALTPTAGHAGCT
jgi:hypothetical protein